MTAELAVGLVAVVLVLVVVLVAAVGASVRLRCQDAARAAARAAALGESGTVVTETARHVAGSGAIVVVERDPPWVEVRVSASVPGGWFTGGAIGISASATAWVEP